MSDGGYRQATATNARCTCTEPPTILQEQTTLLISPRASQPSKPLTGMTPLTSPVLCYPASFRHSEHTRNAPRAFLSPQTLYWLKKRPTSKTALPHWHRGQQQRRLQQPAGPPSPRPPPTLPSLRQSFVETCAPAITMLSAFSARRVHGIPCS